MNRLALEQAVKGKEVFSSYLQVYLYALILLICSVAVPLILSYSSESFPALSVFTI